MAVLNLNVDTLLIRAEGARLLRDQRARRDPAARYPSEEARGSPAVAPVDASTWSKNQQASLTKLKFKQLSQKEQLFKCVNI
ncbi:hypothetical protein P343_13525 [Sporolactobacillus laevolacticus DSM 442]|uniref:Uncharacterized protein n=1 Tax=Sporolactobacillus laevolacticus DSM 442 TaxID=1395513 RepID=V6J3M4_9BACL|nr:hypothetical protein P343_13525 [Sporolactobacillus laevolacticus DSM 442]